MCDWNGWIYKASDDADDSEESMDDDDPEPEDYEPNSDNNSKEQKQQKEEIYSPGTTSTQKIKVSNSYQWWAVPKLSK